MHIILCNHSFIITVENRSKDRYLFLGEIEIEKKIEFQQMVINRVSLNSYKIVSFFISFHS